MWTDLQHDKMLLRLAEQKDDLNALLEDVASKASQIMTNSTTNFIGESSGVDNEAKKTIELKGEVL